MILRLIRENPRTSARELSDKVGISARKVEENISKPTFGSNDIVIS
jgi:ATP-dependent DNA helicase RecG